MRTFCFFKENLGFSEEISILEENGSVLEENKAFGVAFSWKIWHFKPTFKSFFKTNVMLFSNFYLKINVWRHVLIFVSVSMFQYNILLIF